MCRHRGDEMSLAGRQNGKDNLVILKHIEPEGVSTCSKQNVQIATKIYLLNQGNVNTAV